MECDLDCIRFHVEDFADLSSRKVASVSECQEIAIPFIETRQRGSEIEAMNGRFRVAGARAFRNLFGRQFRAPLLVSDAAARDPD